MMRPYCTLGAICAKLAKPSDNLLYHRLKMNLHNAQQASKIRSLTRFHFIAGLPRSGVSVLAALLAQNPRFVARNSSPAQKVFTNALQRCSPGGSEAEILDDGQKVALMRGIVDAVYHDRPFDSVVFDANRDWLPDMEALVQLYPLSRFIICVRNPAAIASSYLMSTPGKADSIAAEHKIEESLTRTAADLVAPDGEIGIELGRLRAALSSGQAERIFVLDYDRLADDPEEVMDVLYDFLREPEFAHDFDDIGKSGIEGVKGPVERSAHPGVLSTRVVLQLSGRAFWRNLKRTSATMMLGRSR